jgi:uncharacterized protein YhaN
VRIGRLELLAFGPFTGTVLDFSASSPGGLFVVFGPNEAGKSSALRAVQNLFFGFEERTPDAHLHRYETLRIAAELETDRGPLFVQRLKRRKDSLRNESDDPLDESVLARCLQGLDRVTFGRSFGLGHADLEAAGEAMLRGEGSVGETLFDAGAGGPGVRQVVSALEAESTALFLPRGQKELNRAFERLRDVQRRARDALKPPESFQKQKAELDAARAEQRLVVERIADKRETQNRLSDLKKALPSVQRRRQCEAELEALGLVPEIPETAVERRERVQARLAHSRATVSRLASDLERRRTRLSELGPRDALLSLGSARASKLRDAVGRTRKAREDLPRLEAELAAEKTEISAAALRLGQPGALDRLRESSVSSVERAKIQRLATDFERLRESARRSERSLHTAESELTTLRHRLEQLPPASLTEPFERAQILVRGVGDPDATWIELERERAELELLAERRVRALSPFLPSLHALERAVLPSIECVERFAREEAELAAARARLDDERSVVRRRLLEADESLASIAAGPRVPSEQELTELRAERDAMLGRLAKTARAGSPVGDEAFSALERLLLRADALSDRLRHEAARVAELAHATAARDAARDAEKRLETESARLDERARISRAAWAAAHAEAGFAPRSAEETRAFLRHAEAAREIAERLSSWRSRADAFRAARERCREALTAVVGHVSADEPLAPAIERLRRFDVERLERARRREALVLEIEARELALGAADSERKQADQALLAWKSEWADAVRSFGADERMSPVEALELLEALSALQQRVSAALRLEKRVSGILRDEAELGREVSGIAAQYGLPLGGSAVDTDAERIVERLLAAERADVERERLLAEIAAQDAELAAEQSELEAASLELDELLARAGARDEAELVALETKSRNARELASRLADLDVTLGEAAGGRPLADFVAEALTVEGPRLGAAIDELDDEIARLEEERGVNQDRISRFQRYLDEFSEASAAELAQEEQQVLAEIRERAARYTRLKLASALLDRAIERYRVEHQGPVLKRAGELLPRLTCGSYAGLRLGREERAIVAVQANGAERSVSELSEGTRYQLYLSLRLASIERFLERGAPLPLILDDAFIHFDDRRKHAAFEVLGELSQRMQILFFTHHERDAELALSAAPGSTHRIALDASPSVSAKSA